VSSGVLAGEVRASAAPARASRGRRPRGLAPLLVVAVIAALVAAFILLAEPRPSYDAMGWMVWGHQVLHWNLNTDGAPSWKPLTFLFTLPYALLGHPGQLALWTITAVLGAFAAAGLAAHIAVRLTPRAPGRPWAPVAAALVAGCGVLTLGNYAHQTLIANSDPLIVALCLGAIDLHLSRRHRAAFALVWLAALGRPELWPFVLLDAAWCWRTVPKMRAFALIGVLLVPVCWFVVPGLTSKSWLSPGDLALGQSTVIHGNKLVGVVQRLRSLVGVPMQIAMALSIGLALLRRDRALIGLTLAALLWVVIEIAFALHGWSATARYLIEPAAVLLALAGAGVGTILALRPRLAAALGAIVVAGLLGALVPHTRAVLRQDHSLIDQARVDARTLRRLGTVIASDGGPRRIRECGQPVTLLGSQSTLAWELDMNVGNVGFRPGKAIDSGQPIVFFKPHEGGWDVRVDHASPATAAGCAQLVREAATG
jgi:hypothetical protein